MAIGPVYKGGGQIKSPKDTESEDGVLKRPSSTLPATANKSNKG
jgi:hypothetical protein